MMIPSDTSPDVEQVQLQRLREMAPADRLALALRLSWDVICASKRAIKRTHPEFTTRQVDCLFVELHYGKELADAFRHHIEARDDGRVQ
jgi:hypothetical protein